MYIRKLRHQVKKPTHTLLQGVHSDLYTISGVPTEQFTATVDLPIEDLFDIYLSTGFSRSYISSLKFRDSELAVKEAVYRHNLFAEKQIHVLFFEGQHTHTTDIYSHKEWNVLRHPIKHYQKEDIIPNPYIVTKILENNSVPIQSTTYPEYPEQEYKFFR